MRAKDILGFSPGAAAGSSERSREKAFASVKLPDGVDETDRTLFEALNAFDLKFIKPQPKIKGKLKERIAISLALQPES